MDLNTYFKTVETLTDFSERTGFCISSLSFWKNGKRPIPLKNMPILEVETNGLVTRKEMCHDKWHIHWPELAEKEKQVA